MPQGSVLGPLFFNIYLNDLFLLLNDIEISNYADDTTLYACDDNLERVLQKLEVNSELAIFWFENNFMTLNTDKCKLVISGLKYEYTWVKIGTDIIWESNEVDLLGITLDSELKFDKHINNICTKANRKLTILGRMSKYLSENKNKILYKAFFESQFKYCPLVWMCHSRQANARINRLHERALRIVYDDHYSSFEELLIKDGSIKIHISNIQTLAIELYKIFNGLANDNFQELFEFNDCNFNLRNRRDLKVPLVKSVWKGENSIRYFGALLWNTIPNEIKNVASLAIYKTKIRSLNIALADYVKITFMV